MTASGTAHLEPRKTTILLADDESAVTILFEVALTRLGYHVITAHNGNEAARIGSELNQPIDVLITDWKMPGMTGDVLARQLMEGLPTLAVILMSGYDKAEEIGSTFDPARVTFLQKPISPALLVQTIRILLGQPFDSGRVMA